MTNTVTKKLAIALLTMVMLVSLMVGGTYAYFTDSVSIDGNIITAGDIEVTAKLYEEGNATAIPKIELNNFAPGDSKTYKLEVTNTGSLDADYMVVLTATDDALLDALTITCGAVAMDSANGVAKTDWANIAVGGNIQVLLKIEFNAGAGDAYENAKFQFDIDVLATQAGKGGNAVLANTVADIEGATAGNTVMFMQDINGSVTLDKAVNFDFNGHKLLGDLTITDNTAKTMDIGNADDTLDYIKGDVVITAINATVNMNTAVVDGATTIVQATTAGNSFHFNGGFVEEPATPDVAPTQVTAPQATVEVAGGRAVINAPANVTIVAKTVDTAVDASLVVSENVNVPKLAVAEDVTKEVTTEIYGTLGDVVDNTGKLEYEVFTDWATVASTAWYDADEAEYTISDGFELAGLAKLVNEGNDFAGKTLTLDNDIDLKKLPWTPIGNGNRGEDDTVFFAGTFDGADHTISGIVVEHNVDKEGASLFGIIKGATIKGITVADSAFGNSVDFAAAVVGAVLGDEQSVAVIDDCVVESDVVVTGNSVAGVVARIYSYGTTTVSNCTNYATVTGTGKVGGIACIVAYTTTAVNLENNTNYGAVSGGDSGTGGILGHAGAFAVLVNIVDCLNAGAIGSATTKHAGGMAGYVLAGKDSPLNINSCDNTGAINGFVNIGGMVGIATDRLLNISDCKNSGMIGEANNAIADIAGGIIGLSQGTFTVEGCNNSGNVYAKNVAGGIAGSTSGDAVIDNCTVDGSVIIDTTNEEYSENSDTVKIGKAIGAIVGKHREANLTLKNVSDYGDYELLANFYTNGGCTLTLIDCTVNNAMDCEPNAGSLIVKTENTVLKDYTITKAANIKVDTMLHINGTLALNTLVGNAEGAQIVFGEKGACANEIFYASEDAEAGVAKAGATYVWTLDEQGVGYWLKQA